MAAKAEIIAEIISKCNLDYRIWTIGITHDLVGCKRFWREIKNENVTYWEYWATASLSDALDIELNFINKGMSGDAGGNWSTAKTAYIYIF
jgi:hypothetical protein